jgi:choline-glycine betaine transporter
MQKTDINILIINKIKWNILAVFNIFLYLYICERAGYGHIRCGEFSSKEA